MWQRLTVISIPGLIALLLFFAVDAVQQGSLDAPTTVDSSINLDYQAYGENISTVFYDESGAIAYTLTARRQYQGLDGITTVEQPFIRMFEPGQSTWHVTANDGRLFEAEPVQNQNAAEPLDIEFNGDVDILSIDPGGYRTELKTERLLLHTASKTAETELPVSMVNDSIQQQGLGLFAELPSNTIQFLEQVRGLYVPSPTQQ